MHRPELLRHKLDAHVKAKVAAKPELVQISTAYKPQAEGEKAIPRNKYVEIREEKPDTSVKAKWPEFKTCKYTTEAIVSDGIDKGYETYAGRHRNRAHCSFRSRPCDYEHDLWSKFS